VLPDGTTGKYYIDLPEQIAETYVGVGVPGFERVPAGDVVAIYLSKVEAIIKEAKSKFIRA
jgi:hypothetical protein